MKLKKFEKNQKFESLTKFDCWIIWFHQWKNSIFKKKNNYCSQNYVKNWVRYNCYFNASQHMIKIKLNQIMKFIKRFSTLQKWVKSKTYCKKYCTLKFFAHQIQRNEMFFVFVAFSMILCSISSKMKFEMIFFFKNRIQNKCENDNFNVFVINSIAWFIDENLLQVYLFHDVKTLHCLLSRFIESSKN